MKILVTGGAGYIGSHMTKMLRESGFDVLVIDNFTTGFKTALLGAPCLYGSIGDASFLQRVFSEHSIAAVMNFASFISVGESIQKPAEYYQNNVASTFVLLQAMLQANVRRFIFSSTAAIYGNTDRVPIDESALSAPLNPYGRTKHIVEEALSDFDCAYGLKSVTLRYFNAAGADEEGILGERHDPETHLIPLVLQAASGRRSSISVFGTDYKTPDGTCIRDYFHVQDLCRAHLLSLNYLLNGGESRRYNLGNGTGFSVNEVIQVAEQVTRRAISVGRESRRPGDGARLVANSQRIRDDLGWVPQRSDLKVIIEDAWRWEQQYPWT